MGLGGRRPPWVVGVEDGGAGVCVFITRTCTYAHNRQVVDLSADFRLRDVESYKQWYGDEHKAPELQKEAVYAITEVRACWGSAWRW